MTPQSKGLWLWNRGCLDQSRFSLAAVLRLRYWKKPSELLPDAMLQHKCGSDLAANQPTFGVHYNSKHLVGNVLILAEIWLSQSISGNQTNMKQHPSSMHSEHNQHWNSALCGGVSLEGDVVFLGEHPVTLLQWFFVCVCVCVRCLAAWMFKKHQTVSLCTNCKHFLHSDSIRVSVCYDTTVLLRKQLCVCVCLKNVGLQSHKSIFVCVCVCVCVCLSDTDWGGEPMWCFVSVHML